MKIFTKLFENFRKHRASCTKNTVENPKKFSCGYWDAEARRKFNGSAEKHLTVIRRNPILFLGFRDMGAFYEKGTEENGR